MVCFYTIPFLHHYLGHYSFTFTRTPVATLFGASVTGKSVTTNAQVCINGNCSNNASGVKFSKDGVELVVLSGVDYTLPLKHGDFFLLKSAVTNSP